VSDNIPSPKRARDTSLRKMRERRFRELHNEAYYAEILASPSLGKVCSKCEAWKPYSDYSREATTRDGFSSRCSECSRHHRAHMWRKMKYGVNEGTYLALKARQGDCCLICGTHHDESPLVVDHCHDSGRVRGLLCGNCNNGLGHFRDDPDRLISAVFYLAITSGYPRDMVSVAEYLRGRA
jgi:hypothetical protein